MGKDVIIACDFAGREQTLDFLEKLGSERPFVKIGMELYYAEGPEIVKVLKRRGHRIFLDLKLHDIPNTVKKSMSVLKNLGVDMVNVHAAGARAMMEAAREGLGSDALLIAVTQLTSTSQSVMENEILITRPLQQVVMDYAALAKASGLDGVVCSPKEAQAVHSHCGDGFLTVTPGIRFPGGEVGDQVRVTSPEQAKALGSDYIVVGRPITAAEDPLEAYERCLKEFCN